MHQQYAADGLVCVSIDSQLGELTEQKKVLDFLTTRGATFPNYIFNDTETAVDQWAVKYDAEATPAKIVFNRKGERVPLPAEYDHGTLEGILRKLLAEK